jgi:3-deoxy-manno-octulosonate cytidylyltransferase (CMP-KDO synthetase)
MSKILDCTFRDGGYYTNWTFDDDMVYDTVHALDRANVDIIELGYKSPTKGGPYKKCNENYIRSVLKHKPNSTLCFMIDLKDFVRLDRFDEKLFHTMIKPAESSWFDMCRVAFGYPTVNYVPEAVNALRKLGYKVGINFMQIDLLSEAEITHSMPVIAGISQQIEYFYVPDSFGTIIPSSLSTYKSYLNKLIPQTKLGLHTHDNLGLAFANTLEAVLLDYDIVDSTITGMGRGVGNCKTEQLLMYQNNSNIQEILQIANKWFEPIKEDCKWGWSKEYMTTSIMGTHPTYAQQLLTSFNSPDNIFNFLSEKTRKSFDALEIDKMLEPKVCVIIPARYTSTRLPGKPLAELHGKPMVIRVAEQAAKCVGKEHVYIATENLKIHDAVVDHGFQVVMTSDQCPTGTDRVAEASQELEYDFFVNLQGDEPLIKPEDITKAIEAKKIHYNKVVNCYTTITENEALSRNSIKMVVKPNEELMYASRSPIPGTKAGISDVLYKQVCIYVFNKEEMIMFTDGGKTPIEELEDVEIIRFIEKSYPVHMVRVSSSSVAVDTQEDLEKVRELLNAS